MSKFTHIFLDLDGTITNPKSGITKSVAKSLDYFSIPYDGLDSLTSFIGPPLDSSFATYGLKEAEISMAIKIFRDAYAENGMLDCYIYDGIADLLKSLKANNKKVFLATSKVRDYAIEILEHFELIQYFDFVSGSEFDGSRTAKADVIAYALEQTQTVVSPTVVMVGDRKHDIIGAKAHGITAISIKYGFGTDEEFITAGADYIIDSVEDLKKFLI